MLDPLLQRIEIVKALGDLYAVLLHPGRVEGEDRGVHVAREDSVYYVA